VDQYLHYTYLMASGQLDDIRKAIKKKAGRPDSLHQTFCFRQITTSSSGEPSLPVLTIEGDKPESRQPDAIRLETFVEMLRMRKGSWF